MHSSDRALFPCRASLHKEFTRKPLKFSHCTASLFARWHWPLRARCTTINKEHCADPAQCLLLLPITHPCQQNPFPWTNGKSFEICKTLCLQPIWRKKDIGWRCIKLHILTEFGIISDISFFSSYISFLGYLYHEAILLSSNSNTMSKVSKEFWKMYEILSANNVVVA